MKFKEFDIKKADAAVRTGVAATIGGAMDKAQAATGFAGMSDPTSSEPKNKDKDNDKKSNKTPELRKLKTGTYFIDNKKRTWVYSNETRKWHDADNNDATVDDVTGYKLFQKAKDNKKHVVESILKEGGNVFQGTEPFDHKLIPNMMKQINQVLSKAGAKALPIGSGATPTPGKISGDLDMIVDSQTLQDHFKVSTDKEARIELEKLFQQAGLDTAKTGTSVHVKTQVGGTAQQVDIMVVPNSETAQKFHVHDIPKGSQYKGKHKQIAIAYLSKEKGYKWSPYKGLVNRETNELIANDLDKIAKIIIGPNASGKDLGSVESIAKALPDGGKQMMSDLEMDAGFNK